MSLISGFVFTDESLEELLTIDHTKSVTKIKKAVIIPIPW